MPGLLPDVDPDGLLEFSVVYTDRALNHMSKRFIGVMQDILSTLKGVYGAQTAVLVPGSGTFGMEAVVRQFANREKVLIVRNGFFSYRWSQILDMGGLGGGAVVCQARQQGTRRAGALGAVSGGGGGSGDPRRKAQGRVRAACGDRQRHHHLRRLPAHRRCRGARGRCLVRARTASPRARCGWTCAQPTWTC